MQVRVVRAGEAHRQLMLGQRQHMHAVKTGRVACGNRRTKKETSYRETLRFADTTCSADDD